MAEALQKFDFRSSAYQRPNQNWLCGHTADGCPCQIGPDERGNCRATFECNPIRLPQKDRWTCTRSVAAGGPCENGPLADGTCCRAIIRCKPVRSWRARVGAASGWVTILTVGLLLIIFTGGYRSDFINPGDLTFQHSRVGSCAGCHSSFDDGPLSWPHAAFAKSPEIEDSKRCVACHELGTNTLSPHGFPKAELAAITNRAGRPTSPSTPLDLQLTRALLPLRTDGGAALPCMTCHQEHRGQAVDLTDITNGRCVICHSAQFSSLADGHPAFTNFPFDRRTRIAFDHDSHFKTHFKSNDFKDRTFSGCTGCHEPDVRGSLMVLKGFQSTCAACHAGQIEGASRASAKGIEIFNVPGIDVVSLQDAEVPIGGWPEDAESEISPFMEFLLSSDANYVAAASALKDIDLLDLEDAESDVLNAVKDMAWAVKTLYYELTSEGVPALQRRLESASGRKLGTAELANLTGLLPMDTIRNAQRAWFPALHREVELNRAGENVAFPEPAEDSEAEQGEEPEVEMASGEDWASAGGWYLDEFGTFYRPTSHADTLISSWLQFTSAVEGDAAASAVAAFELLADPKAPGRCMKCHTIDAAEAGSSSKVTVNWRGKQPSLNEQKFTQFSHTVHFPLLDKNGCTDCHSVNPEAKPQAGYKDRDPMTFEGNYGNIARQTCAQCHAKNQARDSCVTCHNYHIGDFPPAMTSAPNVMDAKKPKI